MTGPLNPFRAPNYLPILTSSNFSPKRGSSSEGVNLPAINNIVGMSFLVFQSECFECFEWMFLNLNDFLHRVALAVYSISVLLIISFLGGGYSSASQKRLHLYRTISTTVLQYIRGYAGGLDGRRSQRRIVNIKRVRSNANS